ncbi:hypothetical protein HELRODRAFT_180489 [Helobdella robusta]|uniref:Ataxin-2 C-terminal domain-containing protein n=1 Tax=Helobdella robusta TaxID=6412 RepID=T1FFZ4_HELRO|nr:hypothetical protein HELRODRAFT_180489 [Helobdella robusta]ESN93838.1 hypothetical protein HELRODRAFT_180489 [Helobdella robusta]
MKAPPLPVPSSMTFDDKPTQQQSTTYSNNNIITTNNNNNNLREVDYSEYEWMEHIDEFDKEVLKVLEEEEALYEAYFFECFDLIECDDDIDNYQYYDDMYSNNNYIINCYTNNYLPNNAYENCLHPDVKCDEYFLEQFSVLNVSTLNPEAPEFQPKFS